MCAWNHKCYTHPEYTLNAYHRRTLTIFIRTAQVPGPDRPCGHAVSPRHHNYHHLPDPHRPTERQGGGRFRHQEFPLLRSPDATHLPGLRQHGPCSNTLDLWHVRTDCRPFRVSCFGRRDVGHPLHLGFCLPLEERRAFGKGAQPAENTPQEDLEDPLSVKRILCNQGYLLYLQGCEEGQLEVPENVVIWLCLGVTSHVSRDAAWASVIRLTPPTPGLPPASYFDHSTTRVETRRAHTDIVVDEAKF